MAMRIRGVAFLLVLAATCASTALAGGDASTGTIVVSADRRPALDGEIYRLDLDGRRVDLSRSPYADTAPFVSPDGKQVAFLSDRSGRQSLYVVGSDGSGLTRISPALPQTLVPQPIGWLPDSRRFLVVTTTLSNPKNINSPVAVLEAYAKGRAPQALARVPGLGSILDPVASPDGRLVAFGGGAVRAVTTSGRPAFTISGGSSQGIRLVWSARNRLAILSGGSLSIADESGRTLARIPAQGFAWSPSGGRLATMDGGVLEVRDGAGSGGVVLRERLFPASEIRAIVKSFGYVAPQLVWTGESRVLVGNVQLGEQIGGASPSAAAEVNVGVDVPGGATWKPSERLWYAHACGCMSRDGALAVDTVASGADFALQAVRPSGGAARTVAHVPGCSDDGGFIAAVASLQLAAGRAIVYQSSCGEPAANLYTVAPDGSSLHRLTTTRSQQTAPAWSPDGTQIAFVQADATGLSCKGCPSTIWAMNADGSGARALTTAAPSDPTWDTSPSWSPDGQYIVFSHSTSNSFGELFVVAAAGGAPTDLHRAGADPAWGPTRIAYLGNTNIGGAHITLRTIAPDGSDPQTLATGALSSPAWSSTGELAALAGGAFPEAIELTGGKTMRVHLPFANVTSLAWSPDGSRLMLVARRLPAGPFDVYSAKPDGSDVQRVTTNLDVLGASWR
jgi:Tol biopolymer transport system component